MHRIDRPTRDLPLYRAARTREIERAAMQGLPPHALMQRAGLSLARLALALAPHARRVWIAAGPGNNGGDGLIAATHLHRHGREVGVVWCGDAKRLPDDARDAWRAARQSGVPIHDAGTGAPALQPQDLAIDALLGIGASRTPDGAMAALVHQLNAQTCAVLAVDTPSGLNVDTGQAYGDACVRARHTLALLTLKPGLFTGAGRDWAGTVWFDGLGTGAATPPPDAWLTGCDTIAPARSPRRHAQHKGSFGDLAVIGGAAGMAGAPLLAARAGLAAGAGRVYVQLLDPAAPTLDPQRPELMLRPAWLDAPADALDAATVVCGCGGGDAVRAMLPRVLSRAGRLVLDADALNAVAADAALQRLLQRRATAGLPTVLTPHPLEAARLLGTSSAQVQGDRLAAAGELAARMTCTVLLKGSGTVIATPGRVPTINPTGNASLASAGSGDVLAGWLGGLWAQRPDARDASGAHLLAAAAAWSHGAAADPRGDTVVRAADLIERLHGTMAPG